MSGKRGVLSGFCDVSQSDVGNSHCMGVSVCECVGM